MENGFSSPRSDSFPVGLRVLVVDDDLTWLKILEKMLKRCSYEVTTCSLAREALSLLRERKDGFDIVISDVNMPDMDGFKLLEHVGLEMDLPVIMMSVDGETTRVMKGVQHGACDYLLKPIRMKELRNIWQHVFRKKIHEVRDIESLECIEDIQILRNAADQSDSGYFLSGGDLTSAKKRKDFENKHEDRDFGDPASVKKARVVWSVDLHQKFVKAVNQIGFDKVGPKKIRDLMNVPWLTRENVASHLQKYRLYLARLQKENDTKTLPSALNSSDISACDLTQNFGLQNSSTMLQNDTVVGHYEFPGRKMLVQNQDPKFHKSDVGSIISQPVTEPETVAVGISNPQTASSSGTGISRSFGLLEPEVNYLAVDSRFQYSWEGEFPEMGFKQEQLQLEHYAQVNRPQHTEPISHEPSMREIDKAVPTEVEPLYARNRTASVHSKSPASSPVRSEPISMATTSIRSQGLDQSALNNSELAPRNRISGGSSAISPLEENFQICWLQGQNLDFWDTYDPELFSEAPIQCYDEPTVDYEYLNDSTGYLLIDQGLFLA